MGAGLARGGVVAPRVIPEYQPQTLSFFPLGNGTPVVRLLVCNYLGYGVAESSCKMRGVFYVNPYI